MNDIRCVECRTEFLSTDIPDESACPFCGTTCIPGDPREDQIWALTFLDWNLLTTQAYAWEVGFKTKPTTIRALNKVIYETDIMNEHGEHPVTLNPHEIRILTFWASSTVLRKVQDPEICEDEKLDKILDNLRKQAYDKNLPLTLAEELQDVRNAGYDVYMTDIPTVDD